MWTKADSLTHFDRLAMLTTCRTCGSRVAQGARHCPGCGQPKPGAHLERGAGRGGALR